MNSPLPNRFNHFAFDAYGTLFDVHSAVASAGHRIGKESAALSQMWRTKQLEYTWVRSLCHSYKDFQAVTADALDFCLLSHNIKDDELRADLLKAYETLSAYEEVPHVLKTLKDAGKKIAVFSNGTPAMLEVAITAANIGDFIDHIISVDELRSYKTAPETYRLCSENLGAEPQDISFQSSNRWDIAGAKAFGFHCIWVNRVNAPDEYHELQPNIITDNLKVLTDA